MTIEGCLNDELEFLKQWLTFFEKIKYESMVSVFKTRISEVEEKIKSISHLPEPIY